MAQVTINNKTIRRLIKRLDKLKIPTRKKDADALGKRIVREMKKDIKKGKSPIRGKGNFKALQEPYKSRKRKQGKGDKPNLKLSGDFLKSLTSFSKKIRGGYSSTIGFDDELSDDKELGHRRGANKQHKRPIIPNRREGFNKRIADVILDFYSKRIRDIVRGK